MSKKADEDLLSTLHGELAKAFMKRIQDGSATAADLSAARQFLKDNNINAMPTSGSPLGGLMESLPFDVDNDGQTYN